MENKNPYKSIALMSGILSYFAGSILIGVFVGMWIDGKIDTSPLFLIFGLLIGIASGVIGMNRLLKEVWRKDLE
ncbi:AtpZ/AtpI family protein [Fictibacillus phosphorivorans]|uniref:AtpZ/AtpI family protein n=1 Tax=Fictibacillus phosphorivorans TaxID=1221500 RepID=UPI003CED419C